MRLGWDERSLNAPELARRAEAAGVQMITVHGRTRCQFYKGVADWSAVRAVKDAIRIPLVVNGDITSFENAVSALEKSGADAVMIGRGAQGQPWLPGQIGRRLETGIAEAPPSLAEQLTHIRALYDEVCSHLWTARRPAPCAQTSRLGAGGRSPMRPRAGRRRSRPGARGF